MRVKAIVENDGRLLLPDACRGLPGLEPGNEVIVDLKEINGKVELVALPDPVQQAQALVRQYVAADRRLADELIAERREEARGG